MRGGFLILVLLVPGCAAVRGITGGDAPGWAERVTITRDAWGVPHVLGETDAAVAFGVALAQAEDNFWQVEENVLRAIGRAANLYGETQLAGDLIRAAFDVPRLAREEYEREPPGRRALWDAYAAGLNHYLTAHPEVRPRLLWHFEPWHIFALARDVSVGSVWSGLRLGDAAAAADALPGGAVAIARWDPAEASTFDAVRSGWMHVVGPARAANEHALLAQSAHLPFFGGEQPWEAHLQSAEGWQVAGLVKLGTPIPRAGHNEHLAWGHTRSASDVADVYLLTFDHPSDPLAYRWNGGWRQAEPFTVTIPVNTTAGVEQRAFRFLRTHHGPLVARHGDRGFLALRIARLEDGGSLQQWYAMSRAATLEEFRAALAQTSLPGLNTMYADTAGNIYYVHGNAVPRRTDGVDPSGVLDGSDPAGEWSGYHALSELPALLNPGSGWIRSAGSDPFLATASGYNLDRQNYPAYMAPDDDNARAHGTHAVLTAQQSWSFEEWAQTPFDVGVSVARSWIGRLIDEYERRGAVDPTGVLPLDEPVSMLRAWEAHATVDSPEMTIFAFWLERMRRPGGTEGTWPLTTALEWTVARLDREWQRTEVAWGEINRLQRIHTSGEAAFADTGASLPVGGAPEWTGTPFQVGTRPGAEWLRRYAIEGSGWIQVVELAPQVRARTIVPFGQSADPASPHHFDQAALYSTGRLKDLDFGRLSPARTCCEP